MTRRKRHNYKRKASRRKSRRKPTVTTKSPRSLSPSQSPNSDKKKSGTPWGYLIMGFVFLLISIVGIMYLTDKKALYAAIGIPSDETEPPSGVAPSTWIAIGIIISLMAGVYWYIFVKDSNEKDESKKSKDGGQEKSKITELEKNLLTSPPPPASEPTLTASKNKITLESLINKIKNDVRPVRPDWRNYGNAEWLGRLEQYETSLKIWEDDTERQIKLLEDNFSTMTEDQKKKIIKGLSSVDGVFNPVFNPLKLQLKLKL